MSDEVLPVNIGNPQEMNILEAAELVRKMTGARASSSTAAPGERSEGAPADISKARRLLGWEPTIGTERGLSLCSSTSASRFGPASAGRELTGGRSRPDAARAHPKEKVWGGDRLARYSSEGRRARSRIGESWEATALAGSDTRVPPVRRSKGSRARGRAGAARLPRFAIRLPGPTPFAG